MNQSYSESDVSLSPSKIFERLQILRQLQIMQRGKLQQHRLQYQDSPEITSSVTEIVSHFSNSTSYNTFRSLLQSSQEITSENNSCLEADISPRKEFNKDYIEGISALNLSQESEFINNSPVPNRSVSSKALEMVSAHSISTVSTNDKSKSLPSQVIQTIGKTEITLDEMPILSPKKDFEALVIEKLISEKNTKNNCPESINKQISLKTKKPFLRRGEGMVRFGIQKNDLVIQNTKALPWRKTKKAGKPLNVHKNLQYAEPIEKVNYKNKAIDIKIISTKSKEPSPIQHTVEPNTESIKLPVIDKSKKEESNSNSNRMETNNVKPRTSDRLTDNNIKFVKPQTYNVKHPIKSTKGQTWASVLTKEQDSFLRQLKQSDYYKNFVSPAKSTVSDLSCNATPLQLRQDREQAEQNMFELLEDKVTHESFNINNSFFNRFLRKNNLEFSGESTPLILQKCLYDNPDLLHLHPENPYRNRNTSCCDGETCSGLTEGSETCSSVSTCCSCKRGDQSSLDPSHNEVSNNIKPGSKELENKKKLKVNEKCLVDIVRKEDSVNTDVAEMNAKLIATSELLKDRLKELEDEIETFRKENANLTKLREELDVERQKFYEEKTAIEQKYNEEKILSDYYLAEEKEKLHKQKQIYDRYVREMRGRLNKKDKDEVINMKKEITELKEEIRNKDAKSTCTIARLRNQIKLIEKDRKLLQDEIDKLKKENRRIQHSNDITRRLTNLKYLEQINKKLSNMSSKELISEGDIGSNVKYKAFEIERQSRSKKLQPVQTITRRRAKSVPNLNVTSRYAKYFSQKDYISEKDTNNLIKRHLVTNIESDSEEPNIENADLINESDSEEENNLEKMYNERFQTFSPTSNEGQESESFKRTNKCNSNDGFFFQKSDDISRSLEHISKTSLSPDSIPSQRSYHSSKSPINVANVSEDYKKDICEGKQYKDNKPKSSLSILSNRISGFDQNTIVLNKQLLSDKSLVPSPEPSTSRTSISKTNLNPIEIKKSDGSRELRFPNGNVKHMSADGKYSKFIYYNGDVKENFYNEGRIKYFYAETDTYHTTLADGLEVLEFSDGQVEKRYKDGSSEIRLPNGSVRYFDPKNKHVHEEWRFPDGTALTVSASGEQRILFSNGQIEVHAKDHKRREFPDGTVKLVYNDGTSETRYASGRVRIKDKHGKLIMDSAIGQ